MLQPSLWSDNDIQERRWCGLWPTIVRVEIHNSSAGIVAVQIPWAIPNSQLGFSYSPIDTTTASHFSFPSACKTRKTSRLPGTIHLDPRLQTWAYPIFGPSKFLHHHTPHLCPTHILMCLQIHPPQTLHSHPEFLQPQTNYEFCILPVVFLEDSIHPPRISLISCFELRA